MCNLFQWEYSWVSPEIHEAALPFSRSTTERLKDLEGWVYNIEGWANSAGHFGTRPAQGVTDEAAPSTRRASGATPNGDGT